MKLLVIDPVNWLTAKEDLDIEVTNKDESEKSSVYVLDDQTAIEAEGGIDGLKEVVGTGLTAIEEVDPEEPG